MNQTLRHDELSRRLAALRGDAGPSVEAVGPTPGQLEERRLVPYGQPARAEVNAFRELRTRLLSIGDGPFVTLVAPVGRGSGGSYVARNLAAALAFDATRNVLLVDCDLRHPAQAATLRVDAGRGGLVDYLEHRVPDVDAVIYDTAVPRLRLLPAGAWHDAGVEHFSARRMGALLELLRQRHPDTYVLLDGPPARTGPEARMLADLADVAVLVAGYGRDTPAAINQAAACFDPGKFAGVVFNEGP